MRHYFFNNTVAHDLARLPQLSSVFLGAPGLARVAKTQKARGGVFGGGEAISSAFGGCPRLAAATREENSHCAPRVVRSPTLCVKAARRHTFLLLGLLHAHTHTTQGVQGG